MQATAVSTSSGAPGAGRASPWIIDARHDLAFFVATPLLLMPLVALARSQFSVAEIGLYVAAFGATGHHLPGLLRAYGDRDLFERFRVRFIAAPLLLTACCVGLANSDLTALSVIVLVWGTWHGLAQVFGVMRIYDVRVGATAPRTVRLDRWMCIAWFGAGLLFSSGRMASLLETAYGAGVPLVPPEFVRGFQALWGTATAAITVAFLVHHAVERRRGAPQSPVKLPLMLSSFGFWWYAMVWIDNPILGIALFEMFHDVQYLAIAWVFNRNRIDKGYPMGEFSRFLFRPSGLMIALYVMIALLYGYAIHMPGLVESEVIKRSLLGLVATSALLHFYYDGFIWKVRERSTRESLGLSGGSTERPALWHRGWAHGAQWALFVVPLVALGASQLSGVESQLERRRNIVAAVPSAYSLTQLGLALLEGGQLPEATEQFEAVLRIDPDSGPAHRKLGEALLRQGRLAEAIDHHRRAVALSPGSADRQRDLGLALAKAGNTDEAIEALERARELDPGSARITDGLATVLLRANRQAEAIPLLRDVASQRPESWEAAYNLAAGLAAVGEDARALRHFRRAVELNGDAWQAHQGLGLTLRRVGEPDNATRHLRRAAALRRDGSGAS